MRRSLAVILSAAALGTMVVAATGCAEHRYQTSTPYYDSPYYGYSGWDAAEQARYREWLAERRYGNLEYNRLTAERQQEYWAWRNARYGQSVEDRYRDYNRQRAENNARERDQDRDARERDRNRDLRNREQNPYVRNRDDQRGVRDRDDGRGARDRDDRNRASRNHSQDKDHDRKATDRDRDRDHDHDHR
jgi:hypothetical protein